MTGESLPGGYTETRPSMVKYWTRVMLDNVIPGTLFAMIAYGQLFGAYGLLQAEPATVHEAEIRGWAIAQRIASGVFFLLAAYLFTVRAPRRGSRSDPIGAAIALAGTFCLTFIGLLPPAEPAPERTIPSLALMLFGIGFGFVSLLTLGRCFGIFPEARGLVTRGPYRYVRHPLYLAEIISSAGLIIGALSVWSLGLFVVFVLLQYARAILEERALTKSMPEYASYAAHTWRIVPGLH